MHDFNSLPDSPEELKRIILRLSENAERQKMQISHLERIIIDFRRDRFGRKSEKTDPKDILFGMLFNEAEAGLSDQESLYDAHSETEHVKSYSRSRKGRKPLPAGIPRETVIHDIPDSEKICACGETLSRIGEETSEQLKYIPAVLSVLRHVRLKYACTRCRGDERDEAGKIVFTAPMPAQLLPKSILTPELFVYIILSKFLDHIPFYRMEKMLLRLEIQITRATFSNWTVGVHERYGHLFGFMKDLLLEGRLVGIDETTLQVHREQGRENTLKSYMWVMRGGRPDRPVLMYHYREKRNADFLKDFLKGYGGVVQTDGWTSYDTHLNKMEGVTHAACMAHIRREFEKLWKSDKIPAAGEVLLRIRALYGIEKEIREQELMKKEMYSEIVRIRQEEAKPVFEALYELLRELHVRYPHSFGLGKAVSYALGQWPKMETYLSHGECQIDNNLVENAVRPFVLGRKNWLFSDCPEGAEASAFWYSLIQTVKANGKNPNYVLLKLLARLPLCENQEQCRKLFFDCMEWS